MSKPRHMGHDHEHCDHDHGKGKAHSHLPKADIKPPKTDSHGHGHGHGHHHHHHASGNLKVALILNASFALIELFGGLWTGSVAILADAVHDFGDALALLLALVMERKSEKGSDSRFSYGYRRLSLLSAVLTCVFLLVASTFVLTEAIPRLFNPTTPKLEGMLGFAILGIAVNGYAAWRLVRGKTMNERVVSWHLIEDVFGWVTVLIGTIVMMFVDAPIIDPIMSVGFTLFIFWGVIKSLRSTVKLFLQGIPEDIDFETLQSEINALPGVQGSHDAHLWSLDGAQHVLTIHVVVEKDATLVQIDEVKTKVRSAVRSRGHIHVTVEIERGHSDCHISHT